MNIGFDENTAIEEYIIDIRDKNDVIKHRYALNSKDIEKNILMSEHYIQLEEFSLDSLVKFVRTDYIIWEGEKYMIKEDYIPDQVNKFNYKYTLRFDHWTTFLQDDTFYYTNQNLEEADWSLMSNAATHFQLIADNANRYFGVNTFNVGTIEFAEMKLLQFSKVSIWDAATLIADAYKAEWYLTGTTFHLVKKFSYGSEIDFESEISVEKMDRSEGENSEKFTRILSFGSTRNIPANYRETTPTEAVDAIYQKRLRIPQSKGNFIDIRPNLSPEEVKSAVVIFDDIYPKRIGTMSSISTVEYTDTNETTGVVTKWNAYRFKDTGLTFKEKYRLPGIELRIVFQSGALNRTDYEVKFNPLGKAETDPESQLFEIIRNEDYGKALPNDTLKPQNGDTYILYGFNIQLVSDQYVPAGELKLYDTAVQWLADNNKDKSVFECPTMIEYFEANEMDLEIGQKVKLIHSQFEGGFRSSRIQGYEKHLLDKYQATYTVGDNAAYSWPKDIEESIKELQIAGVTYQATGRNGVYLIKQFDNTPASDFNAYSAKASDARYLNKQTGGTVQGDVLFQKKIKANEVISDQFGNETFTSGQFGSGFRAWLAANGQSYAEFDNLMVRREMIINTLTIAQIKSVGGQILLSLANMYCNGVSDGGTYWKCTFDTANGTITNQFAVNDQVICRKFTGKNIKYYWSKVTSVGVDFIEISKTDKDGTGVPAVADEIIQLGNRSDVNRQYAIMLSAYGADAPSIKQYAGINSYDLTGKEVTAISPKGNKFTGSFTVSTNGTTAPVYKERQVFVNGTVYYLNDRVSYLGSYWVCIVESTITTPSETSLAWRKDTAGQTDINNAVNDISIGGRNLLLNSTFLSNFTHWRSVSGICSVVAPESDKPNSKIARLYQTGLITPTYAGLYSNFINCEKGDTITVSFDVKASDYSVIDFNTCAAFEFYDASSNTRIEFADIVFPEDKVNNKWMRVVRTLTPTKAAVARCSIRPNLKLNGEVFFREFKIELGNKATDWAPATEDIEQQIQDTKTDAANAQSTANQAQKDANGANSLLSDIASDNKLTPNEKQTTKKEWDSIVSEYPKNTAQATKFGVSSAAYTTAYNALSSYITPLLSNLGATSDINGATFRANFKAYYDARTDLLNAISVKAKELADAAQTTANNAQKEVEKVRTEYKADFVILDTKIASKVSQTDFNALGNRVSITESNITQLSNSITSVVETVDNIKIGGRNLLFGTKDFTNVNSRQWIKEGNIWTDSTAVYNGLTPVKSTAAWARCRQVYNLEEKKTYTFSAYVMSNVDNAIRYHAWFKDGYESAYTNVKKANVWERISHTFTVKEGHGGVFDLRVESSNATSANPFWSCGYKLEEGNKATDWDYAPEDVQGEIDKAQNTADNKNRTYYQDDVPSAPSGGHKVGDLWYKTSLVDSSGNINSDTSKNIYQLQYRWDGSVWRQVNWSVSKSKIEQTDSSISMIVEKTGINSVGAGSSLYSIINQTASEIRLEVSSISIGGRNLFIKSRLQNGYINADNGVDIIPAVADHHDPAYYPIQHNEKNIIATVYSPIEEYTGGAGYIFFYDESKVYLGRQSAWCTGGANGSIKIGSTLYTIPGNAAYYRYGTIHKDLVCKIEYGNKATDYSVAPEDVQGEIDKAQTSANNAQSTANQAQKDANGANSLLADIANDNKLDPAEKQSTKKEWNVIVSEYSKNITQANSFSVSTTAYTSAYNALSSYITPLLSNLNTTSDIVGTTFRSTFKAYYDARTDLLNAVSTKAKDIADSKTDLDTVKAGITINADGVTVFGDQFKVDSPLIANAIQTNELNVGNGNFKVGTDGKISAKGAALEGSLEIGWDGDTSKPVNRITVVDRSSSTQKTKVLITPQNITSLSSIGGNTTNPPVVSGGAATFRDVYSNSGQNTVTWMGASINLPTGKIYDVEIPAIRLEASAANPSTAGFSMYLDNLTTGESTLAVSRLGQSVVVINQSITIAGLQPGNYRLRIVLEAWSTTTTDISDSSFYIPANATYTVRPITDAVEIGANGMCGIFTASRYFHATTDGFFIRMGNYGFRISELNGIQKSTTLNNPTPIWTNL